MEKIPGPNLVDFKKGIISPNKVSTFLVPDNSASKAVNVDFDVRMGSVLPRKGAVQLVGGLGVSHGTGTFINSSGVINIALIAINDKIKVWNGVSLVDASITINANNRVRYANLGDSVFFVNGIGMFASIDGIAWSQSNCITTAFPTLIMRSKQHMVCAGDATLPDRIFFSSVINPTASPFITWNTTVFASSAGGWIDINPDDGDNITALQETSDTILVFKRNSVYRVDTISKSIASTNIYNAGAVSQEATTRCRGMVYFYTGKEIMRTDGGYPEQISRISVQPYLDAIGDSSVVNMWSDYSTVYVSIGDVVVSGQLHKNVVLKFSTLDESWTTYEYPRFLKGFVTYKDELVGGASVVLDGSLVKVQSGYTDFGADVPFNFETQNVLLGNLHQKSITDRVVIVSRYASSTTVYCILDAFSPSTKRVELPVKLTDFVTACKNVNVTFRTIAFGWNGISNDGFKDTEPELLAFSVEEVSDLGLVL